jgi:hypothetical protein
MGILVASTNKIEHHDIAEILLKDTLNTALCIPVLDFSFSTKVVKNLFNSCCNWTDDLCISFKEGFPSTSAQLYTKSFAGKLKPSLHGRCHFEIIIQ